MSKALYGELTEWFKVSVLKTEGWKQPVGSNPTFAARVENSFCSTTPHQAGGRTIRIQPDGLQTDRAGECKSEGIIGTGESPTPQAVPPFHARLSVQ